MRTGTMIHLEPDAEVSINIRNEVSGQRYMVLEVRDDGSAITDLAIFPAGPEFLDKLANECERAVREFVGDVP